MLKSNHSAEGHFVVGAFVTLTIVWIFTGSRPPDQMIIAVGWLGVARLAKSCDVGFVSTIMALIRSIT